MSDQEMQVYQGNAVQNIEDYAMTADVLIRQANIIQEVTDKVMVKDMHYGLIPGCGKKPSLLKPGAEKLLVTFRLSPEYSIDEKEMDNGHRQFNVTCRLVSIVTGAFIGSGVGSCTTMESKYRYRAGEGEATDIQVPKSYWDTRKTNPAEAMKILVDLANSAGHEGSKFGTKKNEAGVWCITTHGEKVEHDNPADYYNTCMKIGKKRAMVDAVLTATAASDVFTQDIEDLVANGVIKPTPEAPPVQSKKPVTQPPQAKPQTDEPPPYEPPQSEQIDGEAVRLITEKQRGRLFAILKASGKSKEDLAAYLETLALDSSTKIPSFLYDQVIEWAEGK